MRILITNDDGIYSAGLSAAAKEFCREHDVTVVAPEGQRSACGHAITMNVPLTVEKKEIAGLNAVKAYATTGTPADCVKLAISQLMPEKPDIVLSGINNGPNVGTDVLYSGTVSAALEGAILGYPSFALSIDAHAPEHYATASEFFSRFISQYDFKKQPKDVIVNINLPDVPHKDVKGVAAVPQGLAQYTDEFSVRSHPRGYTYYWLSGKLVVPDDDAADTDIKLLRKGYAVITPLKYNLTDWEYIKTLCTGLKSFPLHKG